MELPLRLHVLPSQCHPLQSQYGASEGRHGRVNSRQPLAESSGNAQHIQLGSLVRPSYSQHLDLLSPMTTSMVAPPIIPTQTLGSSYGPPPVYTRLQERHQIQLQQARRRQRTDVNPLWLYWQQFQTYRKKQDEKDDKSSQKWPQELEDGFLDGKQPRHMAL